MEYLVSKIHENNYGFNVIMNDESVLKRLTGNDWTFLPAIIISNYYEYVTTGLQNCRFDYSTELPATLFPVITILTDKVPDMIEAEKAVTQWLSDKVTLSVSNDGKEFPFDIMIDKSSEIERSSQDIPYQNGKRPLYQTMIKLKTANDVILFMRDFHPAEIAYDKNIQFELVERGKALEELKKQANSFPAEQAQQIRSGYDKIVSALGITSFDGFGFSELYQTMRDIKCDVKAAMSECSRAVAEQAKQAELKAKQIAQEKQKEAKRQQAKEIRIKYINKIFSKQGDSMLNRYTDAVIDDIKSRLNLPYTVSVYGGSTFSEWHLRNELEELEYPNILVKDIVKFSFNHKTYRTFGDRDIFTLRYFTTEILPINYGLEIEIHTESEEQLTEIGNRIKDWYTDEQTIPVTLPLHNDEKFHVGIRYKGDRKEVISVLDSSIGITPEGVHFQSYYKPKRKADTFCRIVSFHQCESVYFVQPHSDDDLQNNHKLQVSLLRLAAFYANCSYMADSALTLLDGNYKELVGGKFSLLGFLNSQEFKTLKNCYANHLPIDRNLFESEFKNIVRVYPKLYDKTVQRVPFEQIRADIQRYSDLFDNKFAELANSIGVPAQFENFSGEVPYTVDNLHAYAGRMAEDAQMTLNKAIKLQEKERMKHARRVEAEREAERRRLEAERRRMEAQRSYEDDSYQSRSHEHRSDRDSSSTGGLFSSLFKSDSTEPSKKSLWGTAMCPYGKRAKEYDPTAPDFLTIRCYAGCPLRAHCDGKP
ncbi:MAG: cell envelope integrity protein TolA [Clostridia bacterium]|nr:cell envelope integrity protein TolA [Clostridia bacterium]